jgi:ribosomal protein S18 acetylase RimI-like enzyme
MKSVEIKLAAASDLDALVSWVARYYDYDGIAFDAPRVRAALALLLGDARLGCAWLFDVDGEVAGYLVLAFGFDHELGGRVATVTDLFLDEKFRRRGIATAALRHVERYCSGAGVTAIELQVERDNLEARALYARLGFAAHDRIPLFKQLS